MKIVVACDSFKGSLSSREVIHTIADAIRREDSQIEVVAVEIADGGEGTLSAMEPFLASERIYRSVSDPLGRKVTASYLWLHTERRAVIELAEASGLTRLSSTELNPLITTTYGTGELIRDAIEHGARSLILTLGGSATNDAGIGLLQALRYRFRNALGEELPVCGASLKQIVTIDDSKLLPQLKNCSFTVVTDVTNPFYGDQGAARIFAPQKGATPKMVTQLDQGLHHFAQLIEQNYGIELNSIAGAGAAGGVGAIATIFLNATIASGINTLLQLVNFERLIEQADWIITGEGRLDRQTTMGKAPMGVLRKAQKQHIPVIAIAGSVEDWELLNHEGFCALFPVVSGPISLHEAMDREITKSNICRTVSQIIRLIRLPSY